MIWKMIKCHLFDTKEVEGLAIGPKEYLTIFYFFTFFLKEICNLQSHTKLTDINLSPVGREKNLISFEMGEKVCDIKFRCPDSCCVNN